MNAPNIHLKKQTTTAPLAVNTPLPTSYRTNLRDGDVLVNLKVAKVIRKIKPWPHIPVNSHSDGSPSGPLDIPSIQMKDHAGKGGD